MTTLTELADQAWARREEEIFFRVSGSSDTHRVYLSRHGNPKSFFVFNTSTSVFVEIDGGTEVEEAAALVGVGDYVFCEM